MKFALSWILEFVELAEPPAEIARRLTASGLPVETMAPAPGGDTVLDIEVFPNRPDCMSIYGIARELAASFGRPLAPYTAQVAESGAQPAKALANVSIEAPDLCSRYTARVLQGVSVADSPDWLARRLALVGLRPVNNIVDATNYTLWEFGHPLHAFDLDTLQGREIRVRRARDRESIATLDGGTHTLHSEMLVIADAARSVAIAGVMGGAATMVTAKTANLLLESAHFDPTSVRRTSKRLGLSTDASYRFERGADPEATVASVDRVAALIQKLAGGTICPGVLDRRAPAGAEGAPGPLRLRPSRTALLLGMKVERETMARVLRRLQFVVTDAGEDFLVIAPSHRRDIQREEDLIEEVARSIGYDAVPERLPTIAGAGGVSRPGHHREVAVRRALESSGCSEAITLSFSSGSIARSFSAAEPVALANPIAADQEVLRTTLAPGLIASLAHNVNRGRRDVRLYEIGHVFAASGAPPPDHVKESVALGIAMTGRVRPGHWSETSRDTGFYDMKGVVESMLNEAGVAATVSAAGSGDDVAPAYDAACFAVLRCAAADGALRRIGSLGGATRAVLERFDVKQSVFMAELDLTAVFGLPERAAAFQQLARFPAVSRDLSLIVGKDRSYEEIERAVREAAPDRVASVCLLDRYQGSSLPAGTVGLTFNIVYQHPDRTLASEEVTDLQRRILESLFGRFGVRLRE